CRLRIVPRPAALGQPKIVFDEEATYLVSSEKLRIQSRLQLDVFSAPLSLFTLTVPAHVRVETLSYADDVPLPFKTRGGDAQGTTGERKIDVTLPEPLVGKGRTVTIEASTASRPNQPWT